MNIVHVGGAKGVGKTTALKELRNELRKPSEIAVLFTSQEFNNLATLRYGKTLGELQINQMKLVQEMFMHNVQKMLQKVVLLDSHYIDMTPTGIVIPLLQKQIWNDLTYHVILEANPEIILQRRVSDATRERQLDIELIVKEIKAERDEAYKIANETGTRILVLTNCNTPTEAKDAIKNILRGEFEVNL